MGSQKETAAQDEESGEGVEFLSVKTIYIPPRRLAFLPKTQKPEGRRVASTEGVAESSTVTELQLLSATYTPPWRSDSSLLAVPNSRPPPNDDSYPQQTQSMVPDKT